MWVITVYSNDNNTTMFEFETEKEAKDAFMNIKGRKFLAEVIYFNDACFVQDIA